MGQETYPTFVGLELGLQYESLSTSLKLKKTVFWEKSACWFEIDSQKSPLENLGSRGISINIHTRACYGGAILGMSVFNNSGRAIKLGRLCPLNVLGTPGTVFERCGHDYKFFREGWNVVSPSGTLQYGQTNFPIGGGYLPFAVSDPERYSYVKQNRWTADGMGILIYGLNKGLLVGQLTCRRHFTTIDFDFSQTVGEFSVVFCGDNILLENGEAWDSEDILFLTGVPEDILQKFGHIYAENMNARVSAKVPSIWCSWNGYFDRVDQEDVDNIVDYFNDNRGSFPIDCIQIDDGHQDFLGDWFDVNARFPEGIAGIARSIKSAGFMPGLWVAPFWVDEKSKLYAEHPDWIVKNAAGRADFMPMFHDRMIGILDCTRKDVLDWLREIFRKFVELGFMQFKLDFLIGECLWGNVFHDKTITRCEAYRMGLEAIRQAIGDNYLLLGTGIAMASVGLADMARIACDSIHRWHYSPESKFYTEAASFPNIFRNIAARNWYNRVCWVNDPDAPMIRAGKDKRQQQNELTDDEIKMQLGIQAISGGMVMIGEDLAALPENRLEWLAKIFHHSQNPPRILDMFSRNVPGVYLQKITDSEHLLGFFNWKDEPEKFVVTRDELGFEFDLKCARDYWNNGRVTEFDADVISIELSAHTCEIFILKSLK